MSEPNTLFNSEAELAERREEEQRQHFLERAALTRWFTPAMLPLLAPSLEVTESTLEEMVAWRELMPVPHVPDAFAVPERQRRRLLLARTTAEQAHEERQLNRALADFCGQQADAGGALQQTWRLEQLYFLGAVDPESALRLLTDNLRLLLEENTFDLANAHLWVTTLEARADELAQLQQEQGIPYSRWVERLADLRTYLSARAYWANAWYRTISYQRLDDLVKTLDRFFGQTPYDPLAPLAELPSPQPENGAWLLLHAPGGTGKSTHIAWLLSRYLLPRGFVCAHFDYDSCNDTELEQYADDPSKVLVSLADNLSRQRPSKGGTLSTLGEERGSVIAHDLLYMLRDLYPGRTVVLFLDTVERLAEHIDTDAAKVAVPKLLRELHELNRLAAEQVRLRVVLAGRTNLFEKFPTLAEDVGEDFSSASLQEIQLRGFTRDEGKQYLREKRQLHYTPPSLLDAILDRATDVVKIPSRDGQAQQQHREEILPLKLAMFAEMVQVNPDITAQKIKDAKHIDLLYLAERILERIANPYLQWLLRYGVIFRHLELEAAHQVIFPLLLKLYEEGAVPYDDPSKDEAEVREALKPVEQLRKTPPPQMADLLTRLTYYSWVSSQGNYIRIQSPVQRAQLEVLVAQQPIFYELHRAAFDYYRTRADEATDPQRLSHLLREAIFHAFYLGPKGVEFWREQLTRYRHGPAYALKALVDQGLAAPLEDFPSTPVHDQTLLVSNDRCYANCLLAHALWREYAAPLPEYKKPADQLAAARRAINEALPQAPDASSRLTCLLIEAQILLEQLDTEGAARVVSQVEASNSPLGRALLLDTQAAIARARGQWEQSIAYMREAFEEAERPALAGEGERFRPLPDARTLYRVVGLQLVDLLLQGTGWREAAAVLERLQVTHPDDAEVLRGRARQALKEARLGTAADLYQKALSRVEVGTTRAMWEDEYSLVRLYRGELLDPPGGSSSLALRLALTASQADWQEMERLLLETRKQTVDDPLDIINVQLQFMIEVASNWLDVKNLLERGEREVEHFPASHPSRARFEVMQQYAEFLSRPLDPDPDRAREAGEQRLAQIDRLKTPEARVRARAYLLLARYYGRTEVLERLVDQESRLAETCQVYTAFAARALESALKILVELPPLDQIDIARTLSALPGWSSSLVNLVGVDPAEREPLSLLEQKLRDAAAGQRVSYLASFAADLDPALLHRLYAQWMAADNGEVDWPLYSSTLARLFQRFGTPVSTYPMANAPIPAPLDWIASQDVKVIPHAVEALAARLGEENAPSTLLREVWLHGAYLLLERSGRADAQTAREAAEKALDWLTRADSAAFAAYGLAMLADYHTHLMRFAAHLHLANAQTAAESASAAERVAEELGLTRIIDRYRLAKPEMERFLAGSLGLVTSLASGSFPSLLGVAGAVILPLVVEMFRDGSSRAQREGLSLQHWVSKRLPNFGREGREGEERITEGTENDNVSYQVNAHDGDADTESLESRGSTDTVALAFSTDSAPNEGPSDLLVVLPGEGAAGEWDGADSVVHSPLVVEAGFVHLRALGAKASPSPGVPKMPPTDVLRALLDTRARHGISPRTVGAALLDDLLPPGSSARAALERYLGTDVDGDGAAGAVRLLITDVMTSNIGGMAANAESPSFDSPLSERMEAVRDLEGIPWELLFLESREQWLTAVALLTRGVPRLNTSFRGCAVAVVSYEERTDLMQHRKLRQGSYAAAARRESGNSWSSIVGTARASHPNVYGGGLLFQAIDNSGQEIRQQKAPYEMGGASSTMGSSRLLTQPGPVRLIHLLGTFHELTSREGVSLAFSDRKYQGRAAPLTPDELAHALRWLGISDSLVLLEAMSSGSTAEDIRILQLRNRFATALSRLGLWTVMALGPQQQRAVLRYQDQWLQQLLEHTTLTPSVLEHQVLDAHRIGYPPDAVPTEWQIALFYPS